MQNQGSGNVGMTPEFEQRLSNGFSDLSRSFETVFAAYSTLINRAVLTQAMGEGEPGTLDAAGTATGWNLDPRTRHEDREAGQAGGRP